jgi:hypothetical protein
VDLNVIVSPKNKMETEISNLIGVIMLSHWTMFLVGIFIGMLLTILATLLGILIGSFITRGKDKTLKQKKGHKV